MLLDIAAGKKSVPVQVYNFRSISLSACRVTSPCLDSQLSLSATG